MKLGLFNLMSFDRNPGGLAGVAADMRSLVLLAESIGFDTAWFAEHHFTNYSISCSPLMWAAHMAAATTRIRLGTAVVVLPLYNPVRVAQEIAMLDLMSGGRAVLGVGTGYQPYEFERFNVDLEQRTAIFLEYWDIVEQMLTTGRAAYDGVHVSLPESVFLLRPQRPILSELYLASKDPRLFARLAHLDPVVFSTPGWRGTPALHGLHADILRSWEAAGLGARPMRFAVQQYIHVTNDRQHALDAAKAALFVGRNAAHLRSRTPRLCGPMLDPPALPDEPPLEVSRDYILVGDAHTVAERMVADIRAFSPAHYSTFFQFGDMPIERARTAMERFGRDVLPLVERELGPLGEIDAACHPRVTEGVKA
jgi:alkanesulfonate monooxygenase SsuD/methylene tetrahydromethanopterin reductase-like flavin-dependent oxidoreductase (luciferase family)